MGIYITLTENTHYSATLSRDEAIGFLTDESGLPEDYFTVMNDEELLGELRELLDNADGDIKDSPHLLGLRERSCADVWTVEEV
jgi:hypothetical protein